MASDGDVPQLTGRRYRVDELLSAGSHMNAWTGHDERLARDVTIRVLKPELVDDVERRSLVTAHLRQAVRVEDPGLTRIYDSLEPAVIGIVSEPIVGQNLRDQIAEAGPMSVERARSITIELAKTLDTVHRAGIVHGGLDASSIGYTGDGRLVISDLGTHGHPENDPGDVDEDLAALAGVLHELTCGRPPHERGRGRELDPSVPANLAGVMERTFTAEDPWPSAQHFAAALANEPLDDPAAAGFASTETRWFVPALVVVLIAAALGGIGAIVSRTSVARDIIDNAREAVGFNPGPTTTSSQPSSTSTSTSTAATPVTDLPILRITDFDPSGNDGTEHPERLVLINDDDPTRGWQTELYNTRDFGRLKEGVGLIIELPAATVVEDLVVRSPSRGWAYEIFTSPLAPVAAEWGDPVHTAEDVRADTTIEIDGVEVRSVLLWITDLGDGPEFRVTITDVEIRGQPIPEAST